MLVVTFVWRRNGVVFGHPFNHIVREKLVWRKNYLGSFYKLPGRRKCPSVNPVASDISSIWFWTKFGINIEVGN